MKKYLLYITIFTFLVGCDKSEWLNVKSNKADVVPSTIQDYQALLDNDAQLNDAGFNLGVLSSDNYFITDAVFQAANEYNRNSYIWATDIYEGTPSWDWNQGYANIATCNIVLEGINKLTDKSTTYYNVAGTALFFRALNLFQLVEEFAKPYNEKMSLADLGVIIKLTPEVDESVRRSTVEETYTQIIDDLSEAIDLLPEHVLLKTRPSKTAAQALLGRVYFYMEDYQNALNYTLLALKAKDDLIDFNSLDGGVSFPFPNLQTGNIEVVFHMNTMLQTILSNSRLLVPNSLYNLYDNDDLRKTLFFNASNLDAIRFRGYYTGVNSSHFAGVATNELYITASECYVRLGNSSEALKFLNTLLRNRYKEGTFSDLFFTDDEELLHKILLERNKELPYTGIIRWMDLRRLNKDPRFAITITREVNGSSYTLLPNDNRWVLPLPDDEIRINGLEQNQR